MILPLYMIISSILYSTLGYKKLGSKFGYKTPLSIKSKEVWEEGTKLCSKLYLKFGLILLTISILLIFVPIQTTLDKHLFNIISGCYFALQVIIYIKIQFHVDQVLKSNNSNETGDNK